MNEKPESEEFDEDEEEPAFEATSEVDFAVEATASV
jgi:hypothetical protein